MTGWQTLFYKEVLRFWKVSFQTVAAPVLTAVLYLLIFVQSRQLYTVTSLLQPNLAVPCPFRYKSRLLFGHRQ